MEKKIKYITYQTFPAKTANSIQTISTVKYFARAGLKTILIYPLRNLDSSNNLEKIKMNYGFQDNIELIGTIHPLPFKKIKPLERYWYLISHFLWSFFTVQKYYENKNEMYFTRSEWVFYFLSKKKANVIYECHQVSKLKKILVNSSLISKSSKVITLTDIIKKELNSDFNDRIEIIGSAYDDDFFFSSSMRKNEIVYAGSLLRFGQSRGLEILFDKSLNLNLKNLKIIIISSDEKGINFFNDLIGRNELNLDFHIISKINQKEIGEILAHAKVGLLVNNNTKHASLYSSPIKYFEYLASGLNVVATDLDSHRKLPLSDKIEFYEIDNIRSFESAIINAINKSNENNSDIANYSMSKRVDRILSLYK